MIFQPHLISKSLGSSSHGEIPALGPKHIGSSSSLVIFLALGPAASADLLSNLPVSLPPCSGLPAPCSLLYPVLCCAKSLQFCLTLCDPIDCNPPGTSVHGILQARILEWVVMPLSRGSSQPGDRTRVSYIACIGRWILYNYCHLAKLEVMCFGWRRRISVPFSELKLLEDLLWAHLCISAS